MASFPVGKGKGKGEKNCPKVEAYLKVEKEGELYQGGWLNLTETLGHGCPLFIVLN